MVKSYQNIVLGNLFAELVSKYETAEQGNIRTSDEQFACLYKTTLSLH